MTPTTKLRWKKESSSTSDDPQVMNGYDERIVLQQWWEEPFLGVYMYKDGPKEIGGKGEWRDIPIETE